MENQSISRKFDYCDLDIIDYKKAWDLQHDVFNKRVKNELNDTLFLLEHHNTYTLGKTADKANLVGSDEFLNRHDVRVYDIDRGGDITFHGPGQIVGYPILDLKNWVQDTHKYLRNLEEVIIQTCAEYGLKGGRKKEYTGVWLDDRKICAIGIKVSRWVTMHGFAFNVNTNLDMFDGIIPCGITDKSVTSLQRELDKKIDIQEVKELIIKNFKSLFDYNEYEKVLLESYFEQSLI